MLGKGILRQHYLRSLNNSGWLESHLQPKGCNNNNNNNIYFGVKWT